MAAALCGTQRLAADGVHSLVARYRGSSSFADLRASTRHEYNRHLDGIRDYFGDLPIKQFDRAAIRPHINKWRNSWREHPRTADYALQVLSSVLSFAAEEGLIGENPCRGIKRLYKANRAEKIWTPQDLEKLDLHVPPEVRFALRLGALTGLRKADVLRLSWSHVNEDWISIVAAKTQSRVDIPLYGSLRCLLAEIPKRSTTILTNTHGRPWTLNGFSSAWNRGVKKADIALHFHDLRGTAATRLYAAGVPARDIAGIMGWSEKSVERLINTYVKKDERKAELIRLVDEYEQRTNSAKLSAKP
jgi:integrase